MKLNRILINLLMIVTALFLVYVNIGLNISGPHNQHEIKEETLKQKILSENKACKEVKRHAHQYVTYFCTSSETAYFFDNEGSLIVKKMFSDSKIIRAEAIAKSQYGLDIEASLGYGENNPVFVFEDEKNLLLLDYDTYEEVFYMKGIRHE